MNWTGRRRTSVSAATGTSGGRLDGGFGSRRLFLQAQLVEREQDPVQRNVVVERGVRQGLHGGRHAHLVPTVHALEAQGLQGLDDAVIQLQGFLDIRAGGEQEWLGHDRSTLARLAVGSKCLRLNGSPSTSIMSALQRRLG